MITLLPLQLLPVLVKKKDTVSILSMSAITAKVQRHYYAEDGKIQILSSAVYFSFAALRLIRLHASTPVSE